MYPPFLWIFFWFLLLNVNQTMKALFTVLLVLVAWCGSAQTVIEIQTIDRLARDPISQVGISAYNQQNKLIQTTYTNRLGVAFFTFENSETIRFQFEHVAYSIVNQISPISFGTLKQDTLKLTIKMAFNKTTEIAEVVIKPSGVPDTVFRSERVSVQDFEFLKNGNLVLLTYPKLKGKATELLIFDGIQTLSEIELEDKGIELIRDYRGNPHVVTDKNVYGIEEQLGRIEVARLDKQYFMNYIAPIVDTTVSKYFFSNFNSLYPAFDYSTYDLFDSSYQKIAEIEDELMMELYRSEYKWVDVRTKLWAKEKEHETGIDAEIWVGANYFTRSIYYKELYAPLFERNDTIFLFDHYKNWMFRFSKLGVKMDSIPIYYHLQPKQTGWKKKIIQDQTTGQLFLLYEMAGRASLRRFDAATGKLGETIPLFFRYPENITVRSNSVYYIYRPFETAQKKYVYQEKLPLSYPTSMMNNGDLRKLEK